jgi:thiosulfate/3-mercaptopyruvate sulfurtransferase
MLTPPSPVAATVAAMSASRPPLVSARWLADHLGRDTLVIDASVVPFTRPDGRPGLMSGHEQYLAGHVPGAVFADLIEDLSDPEGATPFTRPSATRFAAAAGALGAGDDGAIVVYDTGLGQWAARLWWLFRSAGRDVHLLDGGLAAWRAEDLPLETGHVEPVPRRFTAAPRPELWADKAEVARIVDGERRGVLISALPEAEFRGGASARPRPGHIPGSRSFPASRVVDRATNRVRPTAELRAELGQDLGGRRAVTYCNAGIAASSAALALTIAGAHDVAVYDGSLAEWASDPAAPLAVLAS